MVTPSPCWWNVKPPNSSERCQNLSEIRLDTPLGKVIKHVVYCKLYIWRIDFRFRLGAIRSELIWTIFNEHVHGTHIWLVWVGFSFWIGLGLGFRLWSIRSELIWTCYTPLGGALSQVPPAHLVHTRKLHTNAVNTQQVSNFLEALDLVATRPTWQRPLYSRGSVLAQKRTGG